MFSDYTFTQVLNSHALVSMILMNKWRPEWGQCQVKFFLVLEKYFPKLFIIYMEVKFDNSFCHLASNTKCFSFRGGHSKFSHHKEGIVFAYVEPVTK